MPSISASRKKPTSTLWGWGLALSGSLALNIFLFALMPGLIQKIPAGPETIDVIKQIQVIRIKKPERPPQKKMPPKINKIKPVTTKKELKPVRKVQPRRIELNPQLKIELNPKLPAAPMDLVMPPLETFSIEAPVLKDVYEMGELDTGLMPLVKIPPIYPVRAERREIEGFVTVEFLVTPKGLVRDIRIIKAVPEKIFNTAVIKCVSQWKFNPPTVEGIPVSSRAQTTIRFKLES